MICVSQYTVYWEKRSHRLTLCRIYLTVHSSFQTFSGKTLLSWCIRYIVKQVFDLFYCSSNSRRSTLQFLLDIIYSPARRHGKKLSLSSFLPFPLPQTGWFDMFNCSRLTVIGVSPELFSALYKYSRRYLWIQRALSSSTLFFFFSMAYKNLRLYSLIYL